MYDRPTAVYASLANSVRPLRIDEIERPNFRIDGRAQRWRRQERSGPQELPELGNLEDGTKSGQTSGLDRTIFWLPFAST